MTLMAVLIIMVTTVMSFSPSRYHLQSSHKRYSHERRHNFATRVASNATLPASRVVSRESPVQPIRTIQEYETLVLDEKDKLVIIRFHAPWCKVSKSFVLQLSIALRHGRILMRLGMFGRYAKSRVLLMKDVPPKSKEHTHKKQFFSLSILMEARKQMK